MRVNDELTLAVGAATVSSPAPESSPAAPGAATTSSPATIESPRLREYVEDYALLIEAEGMPRMAGRIWGYLQVCEPPERTAGELARELQASVGSISSMTRLLLSAELIERVSRPGERADRFRVSPESVSVLMRGSVARIARFRRMTGRGLELLADRPAESRARLAAFHDVFKFFEQAMPDLVKEWEARRKEQQ